MSDMHSPGEGRYPYSRRSRRREWFAGAVILVPVLAYGGFLIWLAAR